ncbi:MAG TPA: TerB family tellurite resistance protein [Ignavibacteriaceae bacterium]|nr:TerB family tellurite resistance protein [Ignavibacteriaceae bacterium]
MFEKLKSLLTQGREKNPMNTNPDSSIQASKIQIAATVLMVEMANSDGNISEEEFESITNSVNNVFKIEKEKVEELIKISKEELKESVSLYEFSGVINENLLHNEKIELLDQLWRIIYSDNKLDKYEDKLIKQIGGMLKLDHKEIIHSKLFIKQQLGKTD